MAIKQMYWKPDVCDCELEFTYDDVQGWNGPIAIIEKLSNICPEHRGVGNVHSTCWRECRDKEAVREALAGNAVGSTIISEGRLNVPWRFTGTGENRVFTIEAGAMLSSQQKNSLRTLINTTLGAGKATVT